MKKTILVSLPVLFLVSGAAFFVDGCRSRQVHGDYSEKHADRIVEIVSDRLDLTQTQKATLENIKRDLLAKRDQMKALHAGLVNEFVEQIKNENFDKEKLNQSLGQREASFKEIRAFVVTKAAEFHAVLTPEQRVKLAESLSKYSR